MNLFLSDRSKRTPAGGRELIPKSIKSAPGWPEAKRFFPTANVLSDRSRPGRRLYLVQVQNGLRRASTGRKKHLPYFELISQLAKSASSRPEAKRFFRPLIAFRPVVRNRFKCICFVQNATIFLMQKLPRSADFEVFWVNTKDPPMKGSCRGAQT